MRISKRHQFVFASVTISLISSFIAIVIDLTGSLDTLERKTFDVRIRFIHAIRSKLGQLEVSKEVVLIGVDQKTIDPSLSKSKYADRPLSGGWVTRDLWINALPYLTHLYKPSVVAFDYIFLPYRSQNDKRFETDRSPAQIVDQYFTDQLKTRQLSITNQFSTGQIHINPDFPRLQILDLLDEAGSTSFGNLLFEAVDLHKTDPSCPSYVTAYNLTSTRIESHVHQWDVKDPRDEAILSTLDGVRIPPECISRLDRYEAIYDHASLPFDEMSIVKLGCISVPRDPDGVVRRIPLLYGFEDPRASNEKCFVPSFVLQICLAHLKIETEEQLKSSVKINFGHSIEIKDKNRLLRIPIDNQGNLLLNFEGAIKDFQLVSYIGVLDNGQYLHAKSQSQKLTTIQEVELKKAEELRDTLQNKMALVGATFTAAGDIGPCPIDDNVPLVFIHMTALDNIFRQSFLIPLNKWMSALLIFLLSSTVCFFNLQNYRLGFVQGALYIFLGWILLCLVLFYTHHLWLPFVLPSLLILCLFGAISYLRYEAEHRDQVEIRKHFSTMVSPKVLQKLENNPEILEKSDRLEATMFFSDVAKFTSISEKLDPQQLSRILNDYLTPMTDLILKRDGYLNKYAGDGIMAVWGALSSSQDHATQACLSALEQQQKIIEISPYFQKEYDVKLHVRIGINSGIVSAGMMGSREKKEYTVMGDAVNFAARLEPANKDYNTLIAIGEKTYQLAKDQIVARLLDRIVVEGKSEPVQIYELVGKKGEVSSQSLDLITQFEKALQLYWKRDWDSAIREFESLLKKKPDDYPSEVFLARSQDFKLHPPPADWKGEYVRKGKS
jgi:class 3 adenylate cyclase/CHASE2 domain-containing sensor protein